MESTTLPTSHPKLWLFTLIVFISNSCIMILELIAGRIIAPSVGVSLYTWTSVIGVILAGISLGNYLGGRRQTGGPRPGCWGRCSCWPG